MTELMNLAAALNTLYTYIFWEIGEEDFVELNSTKSLQALTPNKSTKWYLINPLKLKRELLVTEDDKKQLLSAVRLICAISQNLPERALFRERLLYCKTFLPSCVFTTIQTKAN